MINFEDRYTASQNKRWEVSKDTTSRERLENLKDLYGYFEQQVQGVNIAFTLFGSLSKGKELTMENSGNSDVDVSVFVDYNTLFENFLKIQDINPNSDFLKFAKERADEFKIMYPNSLSLKDQQSMNFVADALKEFIEKVFLERFGHLDNGKETAPIIVKPISEDYESSIMHTADILSNHIRSDDQTAIDMWKIKLARFFHLDVGGGMKKYKNLFYQELKQRLLAGGNQAESAKATWKMVVETMKSVERPAGSISPELEQKFPSENLEEFLKNQGI